MREIRPLTEITKTIRVDLKRQFPGYKFSYFHLAIGKWNRPFTVKGKGK